MARAAATRVNGALAPINAKLRGPSDAVRIGVWGKPDAIVVAFGPRELAPPIGGTMFGALRSDTTRVPAGTCESLRIDASVQTGPAPLLDPGGYLGEPPRRSVGSYQRLPSAAGAECRYRLGGIALGWPNAVKATSTLDAGKRTGNALHSIHYTLVGDGWDGRTVVAQPSAERNYVVRGTLEASALVDPASALKRGEVHPGDPHIRLADRLATEAARPRSPNAAGSAKAALPAPAPSALGAREHGFNGDTVSLNPQPLPPVAPDAALTVDRRAPVRAIAR